MDEQIAQTQAIAAGYYAAAMILAEDAALVLEFPIILIELQVRAAMFSRIARTNYDAMYFWQQRELSNREIKILATDMPVSPNRVCPRCARRSYNAGDFATGFCGACCRYF